MRILNADLGTAGTEWTWWKHSHWKLKQTFHFTVGRLFAWHQRTEPVDKHYMLGINIVLHGSYWAGLQPFLDVWNVHHPFMVCSQFGERFDGLRYLQLSLCKPTVRIVEEHNVCKGQLRKECQEITCKYLVSTLCTENIYYFMESAHILWFLFSSCEV